MSRTLSRSSIDICADCSALGVYRVDANFVTVSQKMSHMRPLVKCGRADLRILERVRVKIMDLD